MDLVARIENAIRIVARLIADGNEELLPLFERLERELETHHSIQSTLKRALDIAKNEEAL